MENGYLSLGQEKTFVRKTLEIISQYEAFMPSLEQVDRHEVTLYVNCLLGILIVPEQSLLKDDDRIITDANKNKWGVDLNSMRYCPNSTCPTHSTGSVNEFARHLRNSLSHNRFIIQCLDGRNVTHILFKDFAGKASKEVQTFEYSFTIADLLKFVRKYYEPLA